MPNAASTAKKQRLASKAANARAGKPAPAPPETPSPPPHAAGTPHSKRARSDPDDELPTPCSCKRYRAEHAKVQRRDEWVSSLQTQVLELESVLHETGDSRAYLAQDNTGLHARITALSAGLGDLDLRYGWLESEHTAAMEELEVTKMKASRLERELAAMIGDCDALKDRVRVLDRVRCKYEARERRAAGKFDPDQPLQQPIFKLRTGPKAKGSLPIDVRLAILELVTMGVGVDHVFRALLCCAVLFKISLAGSFTAGAVRKVVLEAGVAGEIQLASTMESCASATISCDSTSHRTITYMSKHLTFMMPGAPTKPIVLALPITTMHSHSSQAQLDDIIESLKSFFRTYLASRGHVNPQFWRAFTRKLLAGETDHAPDQKLMIKLLTQWKRLVDRELRGEQLLLAQKTPAELMKLVIERTREQTGLEPLDWEQLPEDEKMRHVSDAWRSICVPHGEDAYQELSDQEKRKVDLFIWAGCCMHKALNAAKNGYAEMSRTWSTIEGCPGPVRLVSKDKRDAMDKTSSEKDRMSIYTTATGGAVPHNECCGMCFHSGDDKKGEQDVYKHEFEVRAAVHA
jgi:hypothetical protein